MDSLLSKLGDLALGSVPTMIIFLILVGAYAVLVQGPLKQMLAARRERTAGAVEKAAASIGQADARAQEYEDRLRAARLEIAARREAEVKAWNAARDKAVAEAREVAAEKVLAARRQLERESAAAREQLVHGADELAAEILRVILPRGAAGASQLEARS